jgi:hypothetical protein
MSSRLNLHRVHPIGCEAPSLPRSRLERTWLRRAMHRSCLRVVLVFCILLPAGCKDSDELVLECKGSVGSFRSPLWTKDDELIAARIKGGKISFSGNNFLLGRDIKLCRDGDDAYFDSDRCDGTVTTETRQYGTFNRILMTLDFD